MTFGREHSGAIGARNSPVMGNLEYCRLAALRISVFLGWGGRTPPRLKKYKRSTLARAFRRAKEPDEGGVANREGRSAVGPGRDRSSQMDLRIAGRRALVTGSSSGIGYAIAEALAREGAHVILNGRSKKNLDAAVRRLQKAVDGTVREAVVADASTAEGADIVAAIPEVDILVNNLGKYERKGFFDATDSDWMNFYEFNVLSGIRFVRAYG